MTDEKSTPNLAEISEQTRAFVQQVLDLAGLEAQASSDSDEDGVLVNISGADAEALIAGRNGAPTTAVLDALAHIAKRAVLGADRDAAVITIDAADFRAERIVLMAEVAEQLAAKVEGGSRVEVYGLDSVDRKAVHRHLAGREHVETASAGFGLYRRLTVQGS